MSRKEWKEGKSTRSGLLWEVERILEECNELPQILLMENVPQVHAEKNMTDFEAWLAFLRSRGYFNYYKDLNAKDYGIAQNRNRCFCVSILSSVFIDYEFPESVKLEKVMSDYLEDQVDEKYYIKNDKAAKLIIDLLERGGIGKDQKQITVDLCKKANEIKIANCITANENRGISNIPKQGTGILEIGYLKDKAEKIHQSNKVYGSRGIAPTINANAGTHHNIIKTIVAMRGRNLNNSTARVAGAPTEQRLEPAPQNLVNILSTVQKDNLCLEIKQATNYRIRKLTPRECWRLMGYTDADFEKSASVESNTQLYKQAGNAIVKQVLMAIFSQMNIKGVKPWNDMTSEEKYNLIRKSTTEKKSKKNNLTH